MRDAVKVRITLEFGRLSRRAVNRYYGREGLASHEDMKRYIDMAVNADIETLVSDLDDEDLDKYEEN